MTENTDLARSSMPLCDTFGVVTLHAEPAHVRLELEWAPHLCTSAGILHGGSIMALADSAGGLCAFLNLPTGSVATATIESKTNFFGAVRDGKVVATAQPLHVGRTTIVVETEIRGGDRLVAKTTQTQAVKTAKRAEMTATSRSDEQPSAGPPAEHAPGVTTIDIASIRERRNAIAALTSAWDACTATLRHERTAPVWRMPSRCQGWEVRDTYAHVLGQIEDAAGGVAGTRTPDEQALSMRTIDRPQLAERFAQAVAVGRQLLADLTDEVWQVPAGATGLSVGDGVVALAHDARLHDDDVRSLYHESCTAPAVWLPSLAHICRVLAARGVALAVDLTDAGRLELDTQGPSIGACSTYDFVLAATGRDEHAPAPLAALDIYV
jgi:uncharacterized protein (TIGR00369 family)